MKYIIVMIAMCLVACSDYHFLDRDGKWVVVAKETTSSQGYRYTIHEYRSNRNHDQTFYIYRDDDEFQLGDELTVAKK